MYFTRCQQLPRYGTRFEDELTHFVCVQTHEIHVLQNDITILLAMTITFGLVFDFCFVFAHFYLLKFRITCVYIQKLETCNYQK